MLNKIRQDAAADTINTSENSIRNTVAALVLLLTTNSVMAELKQDVESLPESSEISSVLRLDNPKGMPEKSATVIKMKWWEISVWKLSNTFFYAITKDFTEWNWIDDFKFEIKWKKYLFSKNDLGEIKVLEIKE